MPKLRVLALCALLGLSACSTTVEKQEDRFKRNLDTIEAVAAKNPMMRPQIAEKLAGFKLEHDQIMAGSGDRKEQLILLNRRMDEYAGKLDPVTAGKTTGTTPPPGSKLNQPGMGQPGMGQPGMGQPGMGQPGMGQPGGKLGATGTAPATGLGTPGTAPGLGTPGTAPAPGLGTPGTAPAPGGKLL